MSVPLAPSTRHYEVTPLFVTGVGGISLKLHNEQVIPGFFAQTTPKYPNEGLGIPVPPRFGLLDSTPERWSKFTKEFEELVVESAKTRPDSDPSVKTSYKFIIVGRHGQSWNTVVYNKYGKERWNLYWSKREKDGGIVYGPDAQLTPLGESQAALAKKRWREELAFGMPTPGVFIVSPLSRAIRTHGITFDGLGILKPEQPAIIWENCRESLEDLCDKRRTKSEIQASFPGYVFEEGFPEEDKMWGRDRRETVEQADARARSVLDRIFDEEEATFVSLTSNTLFIAGFLKAAGHPAYELGTGGVLPMVIKLTTTAESTIG